MCVVCVCVSFWLKRLRYQVITREARNGVGFLFFFVFHSLVEEQGQMGEAMMETTGSILAAALTAMVAGRAPRRTISATAAAIVRARMGRSSGDDGEMGLLAQTCKSLPDSSVVVGKSEEGVTVGDDERPRRERLRVRRRKARIRKRESRQDVVMGDGSTSLMQDTPPPVSSQGAAGTDGEEGGADSQASISMRGIEDDSGGGDIETWRPTFAVPDNLFPMPGIGPDLQARLERASELTKDLVKVRTEYREGDPALKSYHKTVFHTLFKELEVLTSRAEFQSLGMKA